MATYFEYELPDGTKVLVEAVQDQNTVVKASSRGSEEGVIKTGEQLGEALGGVGRSAMTLRQTFQSFAADDIEIKFSLKATGEAGIFVIGKVGMEANYEVTLKWKSSISDK